MNSLTITLFAIAKTEIETASAKAKAIARSIVAELIKAPTPRITKWRHAHAAKLAATTPGERKQITAMVDACCAFTVSQKTTYAMDFETLSDWLSTSPMEWIDWPSLPAWGERPDCDVELYTWAEDTRLAWIEGDHGPELTSYQELCGEHPRGYMDQLRKDAERAIEDLETAMDVAAWDHDSLLGVAIRLTVIENYLDERHFSQHPSTRNSAADLLSYEIATVYMDAIGDDGYRIIGPNRDLCAGSTPLTSLMAGGAGWDVELMS